MRALLAAKCDPYAVDSSGASALELASRRGSPEAVAALLTAGSPPTMQVARGMMLATKHGHSPVVGLLIKAGAPVQVGTS